jgi:hypothetical protein
LIRWECIEANQILDWASVTFFVSMAICWLRAVALGAKRNSIWKRSVIDVAEIYYLPN